MANDGDKLINSAAGPSDRQHDEHCAIADEWLRHAINGIKEMYCNEDARQTVAQRLF